MFFLLLKHRGGRSVLSSSMSETTKLFLTTFIHLVLSNILAAAVDTIVKGVILVEKKELCHFTF